MEVLRKTAEFRVNKQTEGIDPLQVKSLSLSSVPVMPELLARFPNLVYLTLVAMKPTMKSLKELPLASLRQIRALELSDNAISLEEFTAPEAERLPTLPTLRRLLLVNNRIGSLAEVELLAVAFPELEVLDIEENPIHLTEDETDKVFKLFPRLVALNARDKKGNEVEVQDTEEGSSEEDEEDDDEDSADESSDEEGSEEESGDSEDSQSQSETDSDSEGGSLKAKRPRMEKAS